MDRLDNRLPVLQEHLPVTSQEDHRCGGGGGDHRGDGDYQAAAGMIKCLQDRVKKNETY